MKRNILILAIFLINSTFSVFAQNELFLNQQEAFSIKSEKDNFELGEPAQIGFIFTNLSNNEVDVGCFGVGVGSFKLFISQDNVNFLEYNAGWGTVDAFCESRLKPNEKIETPFVKVLWNEKVERNPNSNSEIYNRYKKENIVNAYAFIEPGVYYIKATALLIGKNFDAKPIEIRINEPSGEDIKVWNLIKDDENFAYFLQEVAVRIPSYKKEEKVKFVQNIEEIIAKYPNSRIAKQLSENLVQYKINEAKRAK
ncbi:MAG TPA: hypothetical protein PKY59_19930 [Pyrinomonadaceae bacterium]|nr:hypothetical protein [Pyrinomonadaceae bacterium]